MSEQDNITDALGRLGLTGYDVGQADTQAAPTQDTSRGLAGPTPGLAALADQPAVDLLHPAIARAGFEVGWLPGNTRVLELFHPAGAPRLLPAPDAARVATDDGVTRVDLTGLAELVALEPGGDEGLYVRASPDGALTFWPLERAARVTPPIPIEPPLADWSRTLRQGDPPRDAWIAAEVDRLAGLGRTGALTALGLLARLCAPDPDPAARAARVQAMLSGALPDEPWVAWARALDGEVAVEVDRLAAAATLVLDAELARALEQPGHVDADALADLCARRDDLECMRAAVLGQGRRDTLDAALAACDEAACALLDALPDEVWFRADERLERVARLSPEAWWVDRATRR